MVHVNSSYETERDPFGCATLKEEVERLRREFAKEKVGGDPPTQPKPQPQPRPRGSSAGRRDSGGVRHGSRNPSHSNRLLRGAGGGGYTSSSSVGPYTSSASHPETYPSQGARRGGPAAPSHDERAESGYRTATVSSQRKTAARAQPPPRASRRSASQPVAQSQTWVRRPPFVPVASEKRHGGYGAPTQRMIVTKIERLEADMKEMKDWRRVVDAALRRRLQRQKQLVQQFLTLAREADAISCEQEQIRSHVAALEKLRRTNDGLKKKGRKHRPQPYDRTTTTAVEETETFDGGHDSLSGLDDDSVSTTSTSLSQLLREERRPPPPPAARRAAAASSERTKMSESPSLRHVYSWMP
eukprot:TRINITY_DN15896_c0_g1_i1.p1 TRINITY_DN15896_c0_g1~~TRINITY_DN15896_c0_g1_i1.p1  ORF type:complete len:356 (+),score=115.11 TRINITY_DN15896_c0_g1_i1:69-1136(+)